MSFTLVGVTPSHFLVYYRCSIHGSLLALYFVPMKRALQSVYRSIWLPLARELLLVSTGATGTGHTLMKATLLIFPSVDVSTMVFTKHTHPPGILIWVFALLETAKMVNAC